MDPAAVTDELIAALRRPGKAVYVALHANHPRELTPAARAACARLVDAGLPMVSQTVLAPVPIRPQKMIQIYCTMVLPIR